MYIHIYMYIYQCIYIYTLQSPEVRLPLHLKNLIMSLMRTSFESHGTPPTRTPLLTMSLKWSSCSSHGTHTHTHLTVTHTSKSIISPILLHIVTYSIDTNRY